MTLSELIAAYRSRLESYEFLLKKIEQQQRCTQTAAFLQFCECEEKRLLDLVQLTKQILADLRALHKDMTPVAQTVALLKKPEGH